MKTKRKLVERLVQANAPDFMVSNAERGYYDDYESDIAFPITRLVADCIEYDLNDIAEEAKSGEFDASPEECEAWVKRNMDSIRLLLQEIDNE